jgi:ABC-type polysaccharide/polyol phosphate export permease
MHDLVASLRAPGFWLYGAWIDVSVRHRGQALGALWSVASTALFVGMIGTLFSHVMDGGSTYFAHLATGFVFFSFIQSNLNQSANVFIRNKNLIQNGYAKYADYVLRMFCTQLINLAYGLTVVVCVLILAPVEFTPAVLALSFTVPLFFIAVLGADFFLSIAGARYKDIGELLKSVLGLAMFITPIIWVAEPGQGKGALIGPFIYANPFYYLIEIVRAPLVYGVVPWFEIAVVVAATPIIWLLAALTYAKGRSYVPLWI